MAVDLETVHRQVAARLKELAPLVAEEAELRRLLDIIDAQTNGVPAPARRGRGGSVPARAGSTRRGSSAAVSAGTRRRSSRASTRSNGNAAETLQAAVADASQTRTGNPRAAADQTAALAPLAKRSGTQRVPRGANRDAILRFLADRPGASVAEISHGTGIARPTTYVTTSKMASQGALERVDLGGGMTGFRLVG